MKEEKAAKRLKGALILGILLICFGLLSLVNYFTLDYQQYSQSLERIGAGGLRPEISLSQVKTANNISLILSGFLLLSGAGILYRKEGARKAVVYFSSFIVGVFILVAVIQPASILFAFPQFLFFAIVILYFTNRNVKDFFRQEKPASKDSK